MITEPQHALDFDGLDFTGRTTYGDGFEGYRYQALSDETTLGNPVPITRETISGLLDGSFVTKDGDGNREIVIKLQIVAPNSQLLADGERDLYLRCSRMVEIGWTPPDGWGARTVFLAWTSDLQHSFDDMDELNLVRTFRLTITAQPHGFSETETVSTASTYVASPTTVTISDGTSATGWTAESQGTPLTVSVDAGRLKATASRLGGETVINNRPAYTFKAKFTRTFSPASNFTGTQYISADLSLSAGQFTSQQATPRLEVDGEYQDGALIANEDLGGGVRRYTWAAYDTSVTTLSLDMTILVYPTAPVSFYVDNVQRSNVAPSSSSSGRESLRLISVDGSARSTGSIEIGHDTLALGETIIYSSPLLASGYDPRARRWMASSGVTTTADTTMVSGFRSTKLAGEFFAFEIPADSLPAGPYLVMARLKKSGSSAYLSVATSTVIGTATFAGPTISSAGFIPSDYAIVSAGVVTLPSRSVAPESSAVVRLSFLATDVTLDQMWLYSLAEGAAITHVDCGLGSPLVGFRHNRLFLDAPSVSNQGRRELLVGTAADRTNAFDTSSSATRWDDHTVEPPTQLLHVVTPGAPDPTVTWRSRAAWHTNAAS